MSKHVLAIDLDGVCAEFVEGFVRRMRRRPADWSQYALADMYPDVPLDYLLGIVNDPVLYQGLNPVPGAAWTLSHIATDPEFSVVYYTARPRSCEIGTEIWLRDYAFPNSNNLRVFGTMADKLDALLVDRPFAFLDDSLDLINSLEGVVPHRFVFDRPWNQGRADGAIRVIGWADFKYCLALEIATRRMINLGML